MSKTKATLVPVRASAEIEHGVKTNRVRSVKKRKRFRRHENNVQISISIDAPDLAQIDEYTMAMRTMRSPWMVRAALAYIAQGGR